MIRVVTHDTNALERLKVAFRACPDDFEDLKGEVQAGNVSLYELSGEHYNVTIAGEIIGDSYFLWGVSGRGVVPAIRALAVIVKRAGLSSISAETYFPGLARLVRKLNTQELAGSDTTSLTMQV